MPAPIRSSDTPQDRLSKLLPADVTAAFLSAKAGLDAFFHEHASWPVFWTFVTILLLCVPYFIYVSKIKNVFHIAFLLLSFVVFALSIAETDFINVLPEAWKILIKVAAIVLPFLWTFLISQIFLGALGSRVEQ
jgi:hypothetical protein